MDALKQHGYIYLNSHLRLYFLLHFKITYDSIQLF